MAVNYVYKITPTLLAPRVWQRFAISYPYSNNESEIKRAHRVRNTRPCLCEGKFEQTSESDTGPCTCSSREWPMHLQSRQCKDAFTNPV